LDGSGAVQLKEFDPNGNNTGSFEGKLVQEEKCFLGVWKDAQKPERQRTMPFLLYRENDARAVGDGTYGIVITQKEIKLRKRQSASASSVALIRYPVAMDRYVPNAAALPALQNSLSPKNILGESVGDMAGAIKGGDSWLDEVTYSVLYNKNQLEHLGTTCTHIGRFNWQLIHHREILFLRVLVSLPCLPLKHLFVFGLEKLNFF
jgi:hypothetical protein